MSANQSNIAVIKKYPRKERDFFNCNFLRSGSSTKHSESGELQAGRIGNRSQIRTHSADLQSPHSIKALILGLSHEQVAASFDAKGLGLPSGEAL
jgi:hypothetical protein